MRTLVLSMLAFAVACSPPPISIRFKLTDGDSQSCIGEDRKPTTNCEDITICDAVLSVRIVPPSDPTVPYLTMCVPLTQHTLCGIAEPDLPEVTVPIPEQVLEVQMAVFARSEIQTDPMTGALVCPPVQYSATGLPVTALPGCTDDDPATCPKVPAVGGRTYYYPGDEKTVVTLGCSDLQEQLRNSCAQHSIAVTTSVDDFDSNLSVDPGIADRLKVSIGEPSPVGADYALFAQDVRELMRTASNPPSWAGNVDLELSTLKCIVVLEDGAQATSAVTCSSLTPTELTNDTIKSSGVRLSKATLSQVLAALGQSSFPDAGMTVGIVVDNLNSPAPGITVVPSAPSGPLPTIQYLSADRTTVGGTQTSSSGIFIAQDAPFGTTFAAAGELIPPETGRPIGGRVEGKVTIVVIRRF